MSNKNRLLIIIVSVLALPVLAFIIWAGMAQPPTEAAISSLQDSQLVSVNTDQWLIFKPRSNQLETGVVIYPGGRVDPRSYASIANRIAQAGYLVIIPPMPLNLAVLSPGTARKIIERYPSIENWVVGGHSLGGTMAANFAGNHPEQIRGLFLWASYPAGGNDLSNLDLRVLSIYATNDRLATPQEVQNAQNLLPADTTWVEIEGGNHAQFGRYGTQPGDGNATIDPQTQEDIVLETTLKFLQEIDE